MKDAPAYGTTGGRYLVGSRWGLAATFASDGQDVMAVYQVQGNHYPSRSIILW